MEGVVGFLRGGHHAVHLCLVVLREWHFDCGCISMALGQHQTWEFRADFRPSFVSPIPHDATIAVSKERTPFFHDTFVHCQTTTTLRAEGQNWVELGWTAYETDRNLRSTVQQALMLREGAIIGPVRYNASTGSSRPSRGFFSRLRTQRFDGNKTIR